MVRRQCIEFKVRLSSEASLKDHDAHKDLTSPASLSKKEQEAAKLQTATTQDFVTDGAAAWLVLTAAVFLNATLITLTPVFGVLFSKRLPELAFSSTVIGWLFTSHTIAWNLGIMATNSVLQTFSYKTTCITCSFIVSVTFMALSAATTSFHFFVLYGFIIPVAAAVASTVPYLLVPRHFSGKRGMAMGVLATGVSAGGIVTPLFIRFLQDEYGFAGTCLLHGAVLLNCCVAAYLYQPPKVKSGSQNGKTAQIVAIRLLGEENNNTTRGKLLCWLRDNKNLLMKKRLLITCGSFGIIMTGFFNFMRILPFAMDSHNLSKHLAAQCISAVYISSTVVRGIVALIADQPWINKRYLLLAGIALSSACTFGFIAVTKSELPVLLLMIGFGSGFGLHMSLIHVNLIDTHGIALYTSSVATWRGRSCTEAPRR